MLFVIRDYDPNTNLKITESVVTDMHKLWNDMHKPEEFASKSILDFFEFEFELLPHKKF